MTQELSILATIKQHLSDMTDLEREIAEYFLTQDLSEKALASQQIAQELHISQAALTRFAKKCGYTGYREFVFDYHNCIRQQEAPTSTINYGVTKRVLSDYAELHQQTLRQLDEAQLQRIAQMLEEADRAYFYGVGSSGLVAREMKSRLMRLGVVCEAMTERDSFAWTSSILDSSCLVFGITLSGETEDIISSLQIAQKKGAKTVLLSTKTFSEFTESITIASSRDLNYGNRISPQYPFLIILDILYAYFYEIDQPRKAEIFKNSWNR
ncbi:MurR/RpiR family transcriptional regulator [Streptococcus caprae]|uniref:MurR/RpiR family transcriptional regulator n=1 Tax=Streptococcus caprae TaxID=1640501 RepID=A0ABV8CX31_9STRE